MPPRPPTLVALLHGPDAPGIVARVAGWIFANGGNILHADQHRDEEEGIFFQRIEWIPSFATGAASLPSEAQFDAEAAAFRHFAASNGMAARIASSTHRPRVVIMVSKAAHCFHDLVLRWKAGEFPGDVAGVISNHEDLEGATRGYGLAFHHTPFAGAEKPDVERAQLALIREAKAELVILARYMQVLSAEFLQTSGVPVVNIHHSFLPAFAGSKPYHQAYARGVKLIGATAHYATAVLDDGPIISQDVARVTHRNHVEDLVRKGRDLEKLVLAQAVRLHLENRILVYGNKTVVFD
jgi:formyltetrahydrofolate deformylase